MAAMISSTNLTKKQRIRNFSSPLRDNSTSMDCWSSGNPLLDEFATSQEDLPPCLLRTVTGWRPDTARAIDLQEVLRTSSSSATVDVCPSVNRDRDGFEREPDFSDTVRRVREWHSRLRQMIRPRRKLQRETFYAFVRASIHSPLRAVADLLARQGIEKARLTCVCCAYTHSLVRIDVRFSLTSLDAMQRLLSEEGVPLLPGLSPAAWVAPSVLELARITGVGLSVIAMAFTQPTPQGAFIPTGVTSLPHRRRMRRTASRAAHRLATPIVPSGHVVAPPSDLTGCMKPLSGAASNLPQGRKGAYLYLRHSNPHGWTHRGRHASPFGFPDSRQRP